MRVCQNRLVIHCLSKSICILYGWKFVCGCLRNTAICVINRHLRNDKDGLLKSISINLPNYLLENRICTVTPAYISHRYLAVSEAIRQLHSVARYNYFQHPFRGIKIEVSFKLLNKNILLILQMVQRQHPYIVKIRSVASSGQKWIIMRYTGRMFTANFTWHERILRWCNFSCLVTYRNV